MSGNPGNELVEDWADTQSEVDRLNSLYEKRDLTDEEKKEFDTLKKKRGSGYQNRIDKLKSETYAERNAREQERAAREKAEKEAQDLREQLKNRSAGSDNFISKKTVEIDGKTFYTDDYLQKLVADGEMSDTEAFRHIRARDKAEAVVEAVDRIEKRNSEGSFNEKVANDVKKVLSKYPHFSKDHPRFNPNDPLYLKASEIYKKGFFNSPDGMSESIALAEEALGRKSSRPDLSEELGVGNLGGNRNSNGRTEEVPLTPEQKETAIRMYHFGGQINPATNKRYTAEEAVQKATKIHNERRAR